jgi:hypothetical protein
VALAWSVAAGRPGEVDDLVPGGSGTGLGDPDEEQGEPAQDDVGADPLFQPAIDQAQAGTVSGLPTHTISDHLRCHSERNEEEGSRSNGNPLQSRDLLSRQLN